MTEDRMETSIKTEYGIATFVHRYLDDLGALVKQHYAQRGHDVKSFTITGQKRHE